jgi:hypothetical protein
MEQGASDPLFCLLKRQEKRQRKGRKVFLRLDIALLFSGKESGKNGRISYGTSPA